MNLNTTDGYVYAIRAIGTNRVKIGFSQEPDARLNQLQIGSPFPLEILCIRRGTIGMEQRIHSLYKDKRVTGEWFEFEPAEIEGLKRGRFLAGRLLARDIQIGEPLQYGGELEVDILSSHTRLWRLGAYEDRHGKQRARRILRFVANPPTEQLGQVTMQLAEELKARSGRGRWAVSRAEAEQFRPIAELLAERFRRDKRHGRDGSILRRPERPDNSTGERGDMPQSQDDAQWPDMPNVLM